MTGRAQRHQQEAPAPARVGHQRGDVADPQLPVATTRPVLFTMVVQGPPHTVVLVHGGDAEDHGGAESQDDSEDRHATRISQLTCAEPESGSALGLQLVGAR